MIAAEMIAALVEGDADVRAQNTAGDTPLLLACRLGIAPAAAALLDNAAVPDDANFRGETALHACALADSSACAELLLQHELNPNSKNFEGRTALGEARMNGAKKVEALLREEFVEVLVGAAGQVVALTQTSPSNRKVVQEQHEHGGALADYSARQRTALHVADQATTAQRGGWSIASNQHANSSAASVSSTSRSGIVGIPAPDNFRGIGFKISYAPDAASSLRPAAAADGPPDRNRRQPVSAPLGKDQLPSPGFAQLSIDGDDLHPLEGRSSAFLPGEGSVGSLEPGSMISSAVRSMHEFDRAGANMSATSGQGGSMTEGTL